MVSESSQDQQPNLHVFSIGNSEDDCFCSPAHSVSLFAGKHHPVGTVTVRNDEDSFTMTIALDENWYMTEVQISYAATPSEIPQTKKGNPIPGKFPYKIEYAQGVSIDTYVLEAGGKGFKPDDEISIAVHSVVQMIRDGDIVQEESAWAEGMDFPGKNWATYFRYVFASQRIYDAFVANYNGNPNKVLLSEESGNFIDSGQFLGTSWSVGVDLGDVNGDGDLDAYVANAFVGPINQLWLNDGSGNFGYDGNPGHTLGISYSHNAELADLDGDLDAFVANGRANNDGANRIWLNDGDGNFTDSGQSLGSAESRGVALGMLR